MRAYYRMVWTTSQTIANGADTRIDFNEKLIDTHNAVKGAGTGAVAHNSGAGGWRFVVPVNGTYEIEVSLRSATAPSCGNPHAWDVKLYKNEISNPPTCGLGVIVHPSMSGHVLMVQGSCIDRFRKGDRLAVVMYQSCGASVAIAAGPPYNHVSIEYIAP